MKRKFNWLLQEYITSSNSVLLLSKNLLNGQKRLHNRTPIEESVAKVFPEKFSSFRNTTAKLLSFVNPTEKVNPVRIRHKEVIL